MKRTSPSPGTTPNPVTSIRSAIPEGSWAGAQGMSGKHSQESITVCASQRNADGLSTAGECLASEKKTGDSACGGGDRGHGAEASQPSGTEPSPTPVSRS